MERHLLAISAINLSLISATRSCRISCHQITTQMRGVTRLPIRNIIKQIYPKQISQGAMKTSTPIKHEKKNDGILMVPVDNMGSVAAFDKPRLPPVLGPLVLVSLFEVASSSDGHDH